MSGKGLLLRQALIRLIIIYLMRNLLLIEKESKFDLIVSLGMTVMKLRLVITAFCHC
jgi:hypothetical protein